MIQVKNSWEEMMRKKRNKVRSFIHAAERTFLVHALSITYARWFSPKSMSESGELKELEKGLSINVCKDLDWLESELKSELKSSGGKFLVGDRVTAADTMNYFSVQFIFERDMCGGRKVGEWEKVEQWLKDCQNTESWNRAVEKTRYKM